MSTRYTRITHGMIVPSLLVVALMTACAPPVTTTPQVKIVEVEVEVTPTPQVQVVEVMVTSTPPPAPSISRLPVISVDNAGQVGLLRRFEMPDFRELRETCGVAFSPDGKYLAAACKSDVIPLWNVESGQLVRTFGGDGWIWANVAFSPDGQVLASGGHSSAISLWDVVTGEQLQRISEVSGGVSELAFSPDGQVLASGTFGGSAMLWDVETGDRLATFLNHRSRVNCINWSPGGEMLVSGGGDNKARIWDASGQEIIVLEGPSHFVEDVEFAPDGLQVAGSCDDSTIRVWDVGTGDLVHTLRRHSGPVNGVTYSPDGRLLASASNDRTLRLWDANSGEMLSRAREHSNLAIRPAFNPDGTLIATVAWDGTVVLWGVITEPAATTALPVATAIPHLSDGSVDGWAVLAQKDDYSDVNMTDILVDHIGLAQMRLVLEDSGWKSDRVHELREFDLEALQDNLDWLAENADEDDVVFLYVAAHGRYLRDVLVWDEFFADEWEQIPSRRRLLVIDSCQAANYTHAISGDPSPYLAVAAVAGDEYGWSGIEEEGLPIIGGVFTHYFAAAFDDPEADADGDGFVSAQEAALMAEGQQRTYMHDVVFAVPEFVDMYRGLGSSPDQDPEFPHVIVDDTIGEPLYLALDAYP